MTRIFTDDGNAVPVTVLDVAEQPRHADQDAGDRRLRGRAGHVRQAPRVARHQAAGRPPREGGRGSGRVLTRIPGRRRTSSPSSRSATTIGVDDVRGRPARRRDGHDEGPRLLGRHHAATTSARTARRTATRARTTRRARSAWRRIRAACFRASAWRASYGNVTRTTQTAEGRSRRCRARPAADQGLRFPAPTAATSSSGRRRRRRPRREPERWISSSSTTRARRPRRSRRPTRCSAATTTRR